MHNILYFTKCTMRKFDFKCNIYSILRQTFTFSWLILALLICAASYYEFLVNFLKYAYKYRVLKIQTLMFMWILQQNSVIIPGWRRSQYLIGSTWILLNIVAGIKLNNLPLICDSIETKFERIKFIFRKKNVSLLCELEIGAKLGFDRNVLPCWQFFIERVLYLAIIFEVFFGRSIHYRW